MNVSHLCGVGVVYVSSTEPPSLLTLGTVSTFPEQHGVDFYFVANKCKVGIQRKELSDLIASLEDGRLAKEIMQMGNLDYKILIVEGQPRFTGGGVLMGRDYGSTWTHAQLMGALWSVQLKGLWVQWTTHINNTREAIELLELWFKKERHDSLERRPGPTSIWGSKPTDEEYGSYVLQSLPGVGPELSKRIYRRYGLPLEWTITIEDLADIPGIGKAKADKMIRAINGEGS